MALSSKLFTEESPGKDALKRCSENNAGHLLRGMSATPQIKDAVARVQRALKQLGFSISDAPGVYGGSTEAAVLKFKGAPRNILGPGQTKPDAIVGIQTIHRLDSEIQGGKPPAPPLEFGSDQWRFKFFGNKGFTGRGVYSLFIASTTLQDSQQFSMSELFSDESTIGGFKGETSGFFRTPVKLLAKDFHGSSSSLFIKKDMKLLNGNLQLNVPFKQLMIVNLFFAPFQEERVLGGALTSGTLLVKGQISKGI